MECDDLWSDRSLSMCRRYVAPCNFSVEGTCPFPTSVSKVCAPFQLQWKVRAPFQLQCRRYVLLSNFNVEGTCSFQTSVSKVRSLFQLQCRRYVPFPTSVWKVRSLFQLQYGRTSHASKERAAAFTLLDACSHDLH
jgi:hypothetical protein